MNKNKCKFCGSENTYGMSRIVGYFSKISNWNPSKQAELKDRQKGNYSVGGETKIVSDESNEERTKENTEKIVESDKV